MPDAQQEQFLIALDKTQQTHVSEYIRANGNLKSLNKDKWPLRFCDEIRMLRKIMQVDRSNRLEVWFTG
jgi:hypothetical protein